MKLYEKYPQLRDHDRVMTMIVENVYATMQLEAQPVSTQVLEKLAGRILKEQPLNWLQLKKDQAL